MSLASRNVRFSEQVKCPVWLSNKSSSSRRRGGGKVRIPRSVRDLQVEGESLFLDFSSQRLFHGLDLFLGDRRQELSLRAVVSDAVSCDGEGECLVQVLMDDHLASGQGMAPVGTLERRQELSLRAVVSDAVSCDGEGECLVQVLMDDHLASGQGMAPVGTLELHDEVMKAYGVVLVACALESLRKDHFQIPVPAG